MADAIIQHSFAAGEFAPALYARTDLAKYHHGAALLQNFFVDYRGGASTRPGTKYILRGYRDSTAIRLIPFQASFTVNYALEFGDLYIRFIYDGAYILETALALTSASNANPAVLGLNSHGLSNGDWVYASSFAGGTWSTLNGRYFIVANASANDFTLTDLWGTAISGVGLGTWSAGNVARVYTLPSPYAAGDLALLKYAQNVNTLVICHPDYVPYVLTLIAANDWTLNPIVFGSAQTAPTGTAVAITPATVGTFNYSYVITSVNQQGQESAPSAAATIASRLSILIPSNLCTARVTWVAATGAASYNVYRAIISSAGTVATGAAYGFVGNVTGVTFDDDGIDADFSITPPLARNPFQGAGVASVTVTAPGSYTSVPTVTIAAAPSGGVTATAAAVLGAVSATVAGGGSGFIIGDIVYAVAGAYGGLSFTVTGVAAGAVTSVSPLNPGSITSGSTPANPVTLTTTGAPTPPGSTCTLNVTWGVLSITVTNNGAGYTSVPAVSFSSGAATATAVLYDAAAGNPSVPAYFQQRLVLAGPEVSPQQYNMSQPGRYYNYDVHFPILPDDAIQATIVSQMLNTIKALIPMPTGLICFGDRMAWLLNGGGGNAPITPINNQANAQAYNGASDVIPIVANYDILYVQAKGSIVRDLQYNFYTNIFTGTDISVLSSHLFFGYQITDWAWAEEPFKLVWAIRDDGTALTLTFVKEQEMIGWAHHTTDGEFKSVCSIVEQGETGAYDAVYFVVERTINGQTVQYIERLAERYYPNGAVDAWCVDAGLQYDGAATATITGLEHLIGETVTGLADGEVFADEVVSASGTITLAAAASVVTVGLPYECNLQTLQIDTGTPTIQAKTKKIPQVTVRAQETLGIWIGSDDSNLVPMKDFIVGQLNNMTNEVVTDLVTGDGRTVIDPKWSPQGQYYIQQPDPLPATVLGVIPDLVVGDT